MNTLTTSKTPVTMTSLELVEFINAFRQEQAARAGQEFPSRRFAELQHKDFLEKVPVVLGERCAEFSADLPDSYGRPRKGYRFPKREACLMAMSYSYELQAAVYDKMTYLEATAHLSLPDFTNPVIAARAWADAQEQKQLAEKRVLLLEAKAEEDKPKVELADAILGSSNALPVGSFAKILCQNGYDTGRDRLYAWLRDRGYLCSQSESRNLPKQQYVDAGYFDIEEYTYQRRGDDTNYISTKALITGRGQKFILDKFREEFGIC